MIWDLIQESQFDKHFSQAQLELTTLLLDENIITELKNQNPKLLHYLQQHKHHFMTELISYTIVMPQESEGYDRGHKLPYISSELLAIDSDLIYAEFFSNDSPEAQNLYWLQFLTFLDGSAADNQILMGYFQKVINNLYNGNKVKTTRVVAHHLHRFLPFLSNGSIADILKKCLILLNTPEAAVLQQRQLILRQMIRQFVIGDEATRVSCSEVLSEVVNKFQAFSSGDALVEALLANEQLFGIYLIDSPAVNDFLVNLLKKSQQRVVNEKDETVRILTVPEPHLERINEYLIKQADSLGTLLVSDGYIINQNKVLVRKSSKKIYSLLTLSSLAIQEGLLAFVTSKFVNSLWKLLMLYPYNNILQVSVTRIFTSLLKGEASRKAVLDGYEEYMLELAKTNLQMLRPLIFSIWRVASTFPPLTADPIILQSFARFVEEHLQPMMKHQPNTMLHHHYQNKKLIVDEQDKQPSTETNQPNQEAQREQIIEVVQVKRYQPPSTFDFIAGWQSGNTQMKKEKQNLFDDFANYF